MRGAEVNFIDSTKLRLRRRAYLRWVDGGPRSVLIVKKPFNHAATQKLRGIGKWLEGRNIKVGAACLVV